MFEVHSELDFCMISLINTCLIVSGRGVLIYASGDVSYRCNTVFVYRCQMYI